jgi:hypothetical protein
MYEIKGYKSFKGHEGEPCAQGTLAFNGKKVADWSDDSWGGPFRLEFINKLARTSFVEFAKTYLATKKDFEDKLYDPATMEEWELVETAVQAMSLDFAERKEMLRYCKGGICYRLNTAGALDTYTSKMPYTPGNVAKLESKYGATLVEIVNKTLGLPLIDDATAKIAQEAAHYKKLCKKTILFSLLEEGKTKLMESKQLYTAAAASALRTKYPHLVEILNERYL